MKQINRRKFLKTTGLSSTGILVGSSLLGSNVFKPNDTINIGVIGTGDRGQGLTTLINKIEGIRVVGCCDIIPFRLEAGLLKAGEKAKGYTDYRQLLDNNDIDAVIIATPFSMHSEMAMDAVDAGKHIYCEKTMSKGVAPTIELVNKAKSTEKIFQVGHQYHNSRLYHKAIEYIKNGYLGDLTGFECQWNRNGNWRRPVPDPKWERLINWRMYREYSGGLAAELSSHQIDFCNWATNAHIEKITGFGGVDFWKDGRETYDNIRLIAEYPDGIKATFTCLTTNAHNGYQIKVLGNEGTLVIHPNKAFFYPEPETIKKKGLVDGVSGATIKSWEEGKGESLNVAHKDPSIQALIDFRDNILHQNKPESNVETGALVSISVQMALDAMMNNQIAYWKDYYKS